LEEAEVSGSPFKGLKSSGNGKQGMVRMPTFVGYSNYENITILVSVEDYVPNFVG